MEAAMKQPEVSMPMGSSPHGDDAGCLCRRILGALDKLAHELAYDHASSAVECAAVTCDEGWMCLSDLEPYEKEGVERDFLYLDFRGLIERHAETKEWFRIRDESEAAIVVEEGMPSDLLPWVAQSLDIVALYRAGYKPDDVADGLLEKYRSWPVEEKYKVQQYAPFLGQRSIVPTLLSFTDVHSRCAYWSSGNHIVANGLCRCGKGFRILEVQG
jgi:hypothetical protein